MIQLSEKYKGFIFDLDGTIYLSDKIISGADETINTLTNLGKDIIFVSNKTTGSNKDYYKFLTKNNLQIEENQIITAADVICAYLSKEFPSARLNVIGENKFVKLLQNNGFEISVNPAQIDVVVVTLDRTFNFEKLEIAAKALDNGARFFAANVDNTCPVEGGEITDAGAVITALEKRTNRKLEAHFGKPSKFMMDFIATKLRYELSDYLFVGDRIETDIKMGNDFGIDTALVNTGVKKIFTGTRNVKPTMLLNSIRDII